MKTDMKSFLCFLLLLCMSGCIKEDRSECPCVLQLDFSSVDASEIVSVEVVVESSGGFRHATGLDLAESDICQFPVPREKLMISVWGGKDCKVSEDLSLMIPPGSECPRLFCFKDEVSAEGESVASQVVLRKNHCVLTVQVTNHEEFPFEPVVKGKICGYGADMEPVAGDFEYKVESDQCGNYIVVLPRQLDSSLQLQLNDGTESVKTFAIGETIVSGGYDWNAPDLNDVTLVLDYSLTEVRPEVIGWDEERSYDYVI